MASELPWPYGIRFYCPECGANVEPGVNIAFPPNLQGKSLREAYQQCGQPPAEIIKLLTEPFVCPIQQRPVRPPEIDAVFLVALVQ